MMLDQIQRDWLDYIEDVIEQIMEDLYTMMLYRTLKPELANEYFRSGRWE